jgi:glycosyltransferase involved in cell wall biosynthesis
MRVGWLMDEPTSPGGAELTQAEFRAAAPDGVDIIDCPPGAVDPDLDRYILHNIVQYGLEDLTPLKKRRVFKYHHDVGPWIQPPVWKWLRQNCLHICCSPIQASYLNIAASFIPPAVDLERFEKAAEGVNGDRDGVVSVGSWRNYGKAPHKAAEWADGNIDFFGGGPLAPAGSSEVSYDAMPALLASYRTFVFLPSVIEPFGRVVAEAYAAGCEIVTNNLVGARYWITEKPDALESAAEDFWKVCTS